MNKGFSLVELIVVIAIMAILVGVAVPVYTGYIEKANIAVDKQYLGELEQAINTVYIEFSADSTKGAIPAELALSADGELASPDATAEEDYSEFIDAVEAIVPAEKLKELENASFEKNGLTYECNLLNTAD